MLTDRCKERAQSAFFALEKVFGMEQNGPKVVIAHTVKGKGVSFMEDRLEWHYKSPNDEQYAQAIKELDGQK